MPKEAGLFRSPDSPFELNAGFFHLRETAKFSVWRIPGTREFRGEQSKIPVSPHSPNGEKCLLFITKTESPRVPRSVLTKKPSSPTRRLKYAAHLFIPRHAAPEKFLQI